MIRINLLAEAKPVKKKRGVAAFGSGGRLNTVLIGAALGIAVLAGLIPTSSCRRPSRRSRKRSASPGRVARLETVLKEVRDFEQKKARLQKKVDLINTLKQNQRGPVRLMDEVSKALPDLVWLEKLDYRGNSISIDGKAFNPPAVANFLENLKRFPPSRSRRWNSRPAAAREAPSSTASRCRSSSRLSTGRSPRRLGAEGACPSGARHRNGK